MLAPVSPRKMGRANLSCMKRNTCVLLRNCTIFARAYLQIQAGRPSPSLSQGVPQPELIMTNIATHLIAAAVAVAISATMLNAVVV